MEIGARSYCWGDVGTSGRNQVDYVYSVSYWQSLTKSQLAKEPLKCGFQRHTSRTKLRGSKKVEMGLRDCRYSQHVPCTVDPGTAHMAGSKSRSLDMFSVFFPGVIGSFFLHNSVFPFLVHLPLFFYLLSFSFFPLLLSGDFKMWLYKMKRKSPLK